MCNCWTIETIIVKLEVYCYKQLIKQTDNRLIKLLSWEKDFLELLHNEENTVFRKVPGAMSVDEGLTFRPTAQDVNGPHEP